MKKSFILCVVVLKVLIAYGQDYISINEIIIEGNKVTKNEIILRELYFIPDQEIDILKLDKLIEKSINNLLNTSLFNFVKINYTQYNGRADIHIEVIERWYYWIYPILEQADRNMSSFFYYRNWNKINYGVAFDKQNFLGLNHLLKFKIRLGYREHYSFYYAAPEIDKNKKHGFWMGSDYFRQKQIVSNLVRNKPEYFSCDNNYIFNNHRIELGYSYRPKLYSNFKMRLVYDSYLYSDSLTAINAAWDAVNNPTFAIYPEFKYEFDNRDNRNYPLKGYRFSFISKIPDFYNNHTNNHISTDFVAEYNYQVIPNNIYGRTSMSGFNLFFLEGTNNLPFFYQMKYNNNHIIRGYEYYYLYSPYYYSFNQTFSYILSNYREHRIPFIKNDKFGKFFTRVYLNMFFDMAYSGDYPNTISNNILNDTFLYSIGAGIAIETYYDRVLEFRCAYNGYFQNFGIFVDYKKTILKAF